MLYNTCDNTSHVAWYQLYILNLLHSLHTIRALIGLQVGAEIKAGPRGILLRGSH